MKRFRRSVLAVGAVAVLGSAHGRVFMNQEEALKLAFPIGSQVERRTLFLDESTKRRIEERARAKLESGHVPYYVGVSTDGVVGYVFFHTHVVRTMPETLMVVLDSDATVKFVEILSFNEPEDYLPPKKWLGLFRRKRLDDDLWVKRGIRNVTGATLTTRAITDAVRRSLAICEISILETTEP